MAIGSEPPIGETFSGFRLPDGRFNYEAYEKWSKWFTKRVKEDGLLFDYAKVIYTTKK